MRFIQSILVIAVACCGAASPAADHADSPDAALQHPAGRIALADVLREVRLHNPAVVAARRRVASLREKVSQERAWDDPTLVFAKNVAGDLDESVTLQQGLPISGRNLSRGRAALAAATGAAQEARKVELEAVRDARQAYYKYATTNGLMEINARNDQLLRDLTKTARARLEVGDQSQTEALLAEGEQARNSEARVDLEREAGEARSALNRLMNREPETPMGMPEGTPLPSDIPDLTAAQEQALKHSPEVKLAQSKIAAAQALTQLAHRQWIPDPMAGVRVRRFREPGDDTPEPMDEVMLELSVSVPWANERKYSAGVRDAQAALDAARADLEAARNETRGRVRDALRRAESFRHHVELYRDKIVPLSQEALKSAQFGYENAKAPLSDVLNAQRKLSDDEATALKHELEAQMALAELHAVTGGQ